LIKTGIICCYGHHILGSGLSAEFYLPAKDNYTFLWSKFLLSFILLGLIILILVLLVIDSHFYQLAYAHDFLVNNDATLVTLVEQIKAETELVNTNFLANNSASAQVHARNAAGLLNELEDNMTQASQSSSDISQIYDDERGNPTSLALVVANIVDEILRKYGTAFNIGYDLTNMSNMGGMIMSDMVLGSAASLSLSMTSDQPNSNSNALEGHSNMPLMMSAENNLALVSTHDYETSQVLADNINEIFEEDLRPQSPVNETANTDKLERSFKQLQHAIINKASPEAIMEVVHVQIHPTLQQVYDLELLGNRLTEEEESSD
jgi:hypothetical protein